MIDYGHIRVKEPFNLTFIPSLENISKIGSPTEIIDAFTAIHCIDAIEWLIKTESQNYHAINKVKRYAGHKALSFSVNVINCCSSSDASSLIGTYTDTGKYRPGVESPHNIIELAKALLKNGIVGKSKRKVNKSEQRKLTEFNANEHANLARIHLGMDRKEAYSLTVTELIALMEAKFPIDDDKQKSTYNLNKDEYDKKMKRARDLRKKLAKQRGVK